MNIIELLTLASLTLDSSSFKVRESYGLLRSYQATYKEFVDEMRVSDIWMPLTLYPVSVYELFKERDLPQGENRTSEHKTIGEMCHGRVKGQRSGSVYCVFYLPRTSARPGSFLPATSHTNLGTNARAASSDISQLDTIKICVCRITNTPYLLC